MAVTTGTSTGRSGGRSQSLASLSGKLTWVEGGARWKITQDNRQREAGLRWTRGIENRAMMDVLRQSRPDNEGMTRTEDADYGVRVTLMGILMIAQEKKLQLQLDNDGMDLLQEVTPAPQQETAAKPKKVTRGKSRPEPVETPPMEALEQFFRYRMGEKSENTQGVDFKLQPDAHAAHVKFPETLRTWIEAVVEKANANASLQLAQRSTSIPLWNSRY